MTDVVLELEILNLWRQRCDLVRQNIALNPFGGKKAMQPRKDMMFRRIAVVDQRLRNLGVLFR